MILGIMTDIRTSQRFTYSSFQPTTESVSTKQIKFPIKEVKLKKPVNQIGVQIESDKSFDMIQSNCCAIGYINRIICSKWNI